MLGSTQRALTQIMFVEDWSSSSHDLALDALTNLERLRAIDCKALVMGTKKTKGLGKKTSSYVQFMWNKDGSLIVEIQADYSYWKVSVAESQFVHMIAAGLSIPSSPSENFALLIPSTASVGDRVSILEKVFDVFDKVIEPTGSILESHI